MDSIIDRFKNLFTSKTTQEQLDAQIAQEAKELKEAPRIPLTIGQVRRCHICGQLVDSLARFDTHVDHATERMAGRCCHPQRGL